MNYRFIVYPIGFLMIAMFVSVAVASGLVYEKRKNELYTCTDGVDETVTGRVMEDDYCRVSYEYTWKGQVYQGEFLGPVDYCHPDVAVHACTSRLNPSTSIVLPEPMTESRYDDLRKRVATDRGIMITFIVLSCFSFVGFIVASIADERDDARRKAAEMGRL